MADPYDRNLNYNVGTNVQAADPPNEIGELVMRLPPPLSAYYLAADLDGNPALFRYPLPALDPGKGSVGGMTTRDRSFYAGIQRWSSDQRERGRAVQGAQLRSINARNREAWKRHGW
jgi:hypothetical protein